MSWFEEGFSSLIKVVCEDCGQHEDDETLCSAWRALQWHSASGPKHKHVVWKSSSPAAVQEGGMWNARGREEWSWLREQAGELQEPSPMREVIHESSRLHPTNDQSCARCSGVNESSNMTVIFTAEMVNSSVKSLVWLLFLNVPGGEIGPSPASRQEAQLFLQPQYWDRGLAASGDLVSGDCWWD